MSSENENSPPPSNGDDDNNNDNNHNNNNNDKEEEEEEEEDTFQDETNEPEKTTQPPQPLYSKRNITPNVGPTATPGAHYVKEPSTTSLSHMKQIQGGGYGPRPTFKSNDTTTSVSSIPGAFHESGSSGSAAALMKKKTSSAPRVVGGYGPSFSTGSSSTTSRPGAYASSGSSTKSAAELIKARAGGGGYGPSSSSSNKAQEAKRPGAYASTEDPRRGKSSSSSDNTTSSRPGAYSVPNAPRTKASGAGAASAASLQDGAALSSLDERIEAKNAALQSGNFDGLHSTSPVAAAAGGGGDAATVVVPGAAPALALDERIRAKTLASSPSAATVTTTTTPGASPSSRELDERIRAKTSSTVAAAAATTAAAATPGATAASSRDLDIRIEAKTSAMKKGASQPLIHQKRPEQQNDEDDPAASSAPNYNPSSQYDTQIKAAASSKPRDSITEPGAVAVVSSDHRDSITEPPPSAEKLRKLSLSSNTTVHKRDSEKLGEMPMTTLPQPQVVPLEDVEVLPHSTGIDLEAQKRKGEGESWYKRHRKLCWLLIVLMVIVGVAVGIGVAVSGGGGGGSESSDENNNENKGADADKKATTTTTTTPPTNTVPINADPTLCYEAHGGFEPTDRFNSIHDILSSSGVVVTLSNLDARDTPQRKALCWLSIVDNISTSSTNDADAVVQRFIILVIYFQMVPTNSKLNSPQNTKKWLRAGVSECEWEGLVCDSKRLLRKFEMDGVCEGQCVGDVPEEIFGLKDLEELVYEDDDVNGNFLEEVGSFMTQLTVLTLIDVGLVGSIPPSLGNLTKLEKLIIRENRNLVGSIPPSLAKLESLLEVDLYFNSLSGPLDVVTEWKSVEKLSLHKNKFDESIPTSIGNMQSLKTLNIESSQLKGRIPNEIGDLANLETLNLQDNDLTGPIPDSMQNLAKLKKLLLNNNSLNSSLPDPSVFNGMESLEEIDLLGTDVTGTIAADNALCTRFVEIYVECAYGAVTCSCSPPILCNCERIMDGSV